jgi:hypothetical protein
MKKPTEACFIRRPWALGYQYRLCGVSACNGGGAAEREGERHEVSSLLA